MDDYEKLKNVYPRIDLSGAAAVSQEEIEKQNRDKAHLTVNAYKSHLNAAEKVYSRPKKKFWQFWK